MLQILATFVGGKKEAVEPSNKKIGICAAAYCKLK